MKTNSAPWFSSFSSSSSFAAAAAVRIYVADPLLPSSLQTSALNNGTQLIHQAFQIDMGTRCVPARMRACGRACVRACAHACLRACVHACMRACVHACGRACVHTATFDDATTAMRIMTTSMYANKNTQQCTTQNIVAALCQVNDRAPRTPTPR